MGLRKHVIDKNGDLKKTAVPAEFQSVRRQPPLCVSLHIWAERVVFCVSRTAGCQMPPLIPDPIPGGLVCAIYTHSFLSRVVCLAGTYLG